MHYLTHVLEPIIRYRIRFFHSVNEPFHKSKLLSKKISKLNAKAPLTVSCFSGKETLLAYKDILFLS